LSFQDLEIKTAGIILEFSQIEQRKNEILSNLRSSKTPVFDELKKLSAVLIEEISLLRIVLKELDFIDEHKKGLKRLALRKGHNDFYWKILERTDRLRTAVLRFLENAKSDAALARKIIEAWETSSKANIISRWIKKLVSSLSKDTQLEEKLEEAEAYHILEEYLTFAENNVQDPKLKDTVTIALKRTNLAKIAACFLVAFMSLGSLQKAYAAEPPSAQVQTQANISVSYRVHFGDSAQKIFSRLKYPSLSYSSFVTGCEKKGVNWKKIKPGDIIKVPGENRMTVQKPDPYDHPSDDFSDDKEEVLLARCIIGETLNSRKQDEMIAIAFTILNRVKSKRFPNTLQGVILQSNRRGVHAFSCFNRNDRAINWVKYPITYSPHGYWELCLKIAMGAISGELKNPIGDADHYHSDYVNPTWNRNMKFVAKIGGFIFWCSEWRQLSAHFNEREFANEQRAVYVRLELVSKLEELRVLAGKIPIKIRSGFRWDNETKDETAEETKEHNNGKAADITIRGKTPAETAALAQKSGLKVVIHGKIVHVSLH